MERSPLDFPLGTMKIISKQIFSIFCNFRDIRVCTLKWNTLYVSTMIEICTFEVKSNEYSKFYFCFSKGKSYLE